MKVLIVDDEPLACQRLATLLKELPNFEAIPEFAHHAKDAYQLVDKYQPDIVLLDIKLPQISGLQIATKLCVLTKPPAIIFCTAYDEFALEAFKVNAVDYLLKPIRPEHLSIALNRATTLNLAQITALKDEEVPAYIHIKSWQGIMRLPVNNLLYFAAENKYVAAYHLNGKIMLDESLISLEQKYPNYLVRINRHILVAINKISVLENTKFGNGRLHLYHANQPFTVTRRYMKNLRQILTANNVDI